MSTRQTPLTQMLPIVHNLPCAGVREQVVDTLFTTYPSWTTSLHVAPRAGDRATNWIDSPR